MKETWEVDLIPKNVLVGTLGLLGHAKRCCRLCCIYVFSWVRGAVREFCIVTRSIPRVQIGLGVLGIRLWKSLICFHAFFR